MERRWKVLIVTSVAVVNVAAEGSAA